MKTKQKKISEVISGKGHEHIPNIFFKLMAFTMKLTDIFSNQSGKNFKTLDLKKNQTVVDYGCGPARYVRNASAAVGANGKVFAVDIHPLAVENVNKKIEKYGLKNVEAVLGISYSCSIKDNTADVVFALDMFHMIEHPKQLLTELARIVKPKGTVIIEDGHQSRSKTKSKIESSGLFIILKENKKHVVCSPKN